MCILLALLSGFLIWVFEKKDNSAEFPKPIMNGIADGFWWSFVSMTTVGYGDKVPLSPKGRVFAVLWVLIGITIFALLTGSLTNEIVGIDTQAEMKILGEKVGGLQHKFHDATMVAQHGGFFDGIEFDDAIIGIITLIEKLKRGDINGFLISRASFYWFARVMKYRKYKERAKKFKLIEDELVLTEKDYVNEKLTLGIMVKHSADYEFLRSYFEDNWLQLQNCQQFSLSARRETYSPSEDDGYLQGLFLPAFYAVLFDQKKLAKKISESYLDVLDPLLDEGLDSGLRLIKIVPKHLNNGFEIYIKGKGQLEKIENKFASSSFLC